MFYIDEPFITGPFEVDVVESHAAGNDCPFNKVDSSPSNNKCKYNKVNSFLRFAFSQVFHQISSHFKEERPNIDSNDKVVNC